MQSLDHSAARSMTAPSSDNYSTPGAGVPDKKACVVCSEEANGLFFKALVCLPCKSFYIRCTKDGPNPSYVCSASGHCEVNKLNRFSCQHCRFQKCLQAGMRRREKPDVMIAGEGQELCRVCGDIAKGIHFGVHSCEGCKKFYRRGLKEFETYECKLDQQCPINPRSRNDCRFCRFQRCISIGMSREAIKMGRPKKTPKCDGTADVSGARFQTGSDVNSPALRTARTARMAERTPSQDDLPTAAESQTAAMDVSSFSRALNINGAFPSSPPFDEEDLVQTTPNQPQPVTSQQQALVGPSILGSAATVSPNMVFDIRAPSLTRDSEADMRHDEFFFPPGAAQSFAAVPALAEPLPNRAHTSKFDVQLVDLAGCGSTSGSGFPASGHYHQGGAALSTNGSSEVTWDTTETAYRITSGNKKDAVASISIDEMNSYLDSLSDQSDDCKEPSPLATGSSKQGYVDLLPNELEAPQDAKRYECVTSSAGSAGGCNVLMGDLNAFRDSNCADLAPGGLPANATRNCFRNAPPNHVAGDVRGEAVSETFQNHNHPKTSMESEFENLYVAPSAVSEEFTQLQGMGGARSGPEIRYRSSLPRMPGLDCSDSDSADAHSPSASGSVSEYGGVVRHADFLHLYDATYWQRPFSGDEMFRVTGDMYSLMATTQRAYLKFLDSVQEPHDNSSAVPQTTLEKVKARILRNLSSLCDFASDLSGYEDFTAADQQAICRMGGFCVMIIVASRELYNPKEHNFKYFWEFPLPPQHPGYLLRQQLLNIGRYINGLALDLVENALFCALCIMASDWHDICFVETIERARKPYMRAFTAYIHEKKPEARSRINGLLQLVPELRRLAAWHHNYTESMYFTLSNAEVRSLFTAITIQDAHE